MRIESISPIVYGNQASPVSSVTDTSSAKDATTSATGSAVAEDFNAVLKKCVSELTDKTSDKKGNSLADILGVNEDMIQDMLKTPEGKQKLSEMAQNHMTSVVLSNGNDSEQDTSLEDLMESSKSATDSDTMTSELQNTFESLASIYKRTTKQADE